MKGRRVRKMKKTNIFAVLAFTLGYIIFFSLGVTCLIDVLSMSMFVSLDSSVFPFPRFRLFCLATGVMATVVLAVLLILNIKASERLNYKKVTWYIQFICAFAISIPLMQPWQTLFDFLQRTF